MSHAPKPTRSIFPGHALGLHAESSGELIRQLGRGFSFHAVQSLESRSGLQVSRIAAIIGIPARTLARRKSSGRLTADESEKLLRLSGIFEKALDLFDGNRTSALAWLSSPKTELEDQAPIDYARTEIGAREVEELMGRLEHGVFS